MIRVAVADDHPLLRKGIINQIEGEDLKVVLEACEGQDLLNKLENFKKIGDTVDVIVLDITMKDKHGNGMNGTECLPILTKDYPDTKVIIMSFNNENQVINHHWDLGASCYLLKSQGAGDLLEAIKEVYKKGFFVTDEMLPAIQGNSDYNKEVDIIQERKKKIKISESELTMMELMFYKEYSSKMLADHLGITHGAVDNKKNRLYNKFRDVGDFIHGELGLMRVAVQYGYVAINRIGKG